MDSFVHRVAEAAHVDCEMVGSWVLVAEIVHEDGSVGFFQLAPATQGDDETAAILKMAVG